MNAHPRNFHRLFRSETNGYLWELNLTEKDKDELKEARQNVQEALRQGLHAFAKKRGFLVYPRFMSQGSAVYKTQNQPNYLPPQQVDHDFGCYLPFSYLDANGSPAIAAADFFTEVDLILERLAKEKKYKGVVKTKKTCSRLIINERLHIDVPLYSVPDDEMHTIVAFAAQRGFNADDAQEFTEAYYDSTMETPDFSADKVLLAHRTEGWKKSDPRKLNFHFTKLLNGDEQLRRISRYLKGFRDQMWKEGGPCSIALMILATDAKAMVPASVESDAETFLAVLKALPGLLAAPIRNPTDPDEVISVSTEDTRDLAKHALDFARNLETAVNDNSISDAQACALIQQFLGKRFPIQDSVPRFEPGRIEILSKVPDRPTRVPSARHTSG